jgi:predicted dienelactone hydrolase
MVINRKRFAIAMMAAMLASRPLHAARNADLSLHDSARNRDLPVKVYYPQHAAGACPVIVFSHGYGGTRDGYSYLGNGWADAGYIVVLPTHEGSDRDALHTDRMSGAGDVQKAFNSQQERTADVRFIISSFDLIEQQVPALRGKMDRTRIGVGGHSMGAGTALLVAGATAGLSNAKPQSFRDERVKAVVAMSPQGAGEEGFGNSSWDRIDIPAMTMSGTRDSGVNGEAPTWRLQPYQHMPPGDKYQVTVDGAEHLSFAVGFRFHPCIVRESTAFWDAYLKGDAEAKNRVRSFGACAVENK